MTRFEALEYLQAQVKNQNLIKHSLAVEAVMRGLARYFSEDEETWGLSGLLHDIDYELTKDDPLKHSLLGSEWLKEKGLSDEICQAVKTHNRHHQIIPEGLMAKALVSSDPITGLIVASALVLPDKKLASLNSESVLKRFKEVRFASGADRDSIALCQDYLNLDLEKLITIALESMQKESNALGF